MAALVSVFAIVVLSLLITRFAVLVLVVTGLSRESARFQARSALTGSGFTTSESEAVVDHPVRRRAIMRLMLIGNAGIVTVVASLVLSFRGGSGDERLVRAAVLVAGLALLWWLSRRDWVDRRLTALMARFLR
jgi:Trk-type K+ transport system membrane component